MDKLLEERGSPKTEEYLSRDQQEREKKLEQLAVLRKIFENDIVAYAEFVFPHHCTKKIPDFHKHLYALYKDFNKKRIAVAAPRGHAKSTITDLIFLSWVIA